MNDLDLFGNEVVTNPLLRDKFIEPPFLFLILNKEIGKDVKENG